MPAGARACTPHVPAALNVLTPSSRPPRPPTIYIRMTPLVELAADRHKVDHRGSVATRVIRSNRTQVWQSTLVVLFAITASAASTSLIIYSRPLSILHSGGSSELTDKTGAVVQTGMFLGHVQVVDLPTSGDFNQYERLKSVVIQQEITTTDPAEAPAEAVFRSLKIDSWAWQNKTRMTLTGTDGTIILIDNGSVEIAHVPSGTVGFDAATGTKWVVGDAAQYVNTSIVEAKCAAANCPPAHCGGLLTTDIVREVTCHGASVWLWPLGVHLNPPPSAGRRLQSRGTGCVAAAKKGNSACQDSWTCSCTACACGYSTFKTCTGANEAAFNTCLGAAYA